ncbi:SLC13 family permease [Alkaliphilus sp. B6464]|uniref:SLC13 family permease n=1 Tax=Alkaliphilus sp. B6464 TaxID=2731219 RepID=UPI001BA9C78A|nr:DASS family sodium-coupled anion symporter [Alkaliphilus sp. B6464]QUH19325.1 DASS family sodium-coupled anion symporter [Alkaliphilus sp. B6464]
MLSESTTKKTGRHSKIMKDAKLDKDTKKLIFFVISIGIVLLSFVLPIPEGLSREGLKMLSIALAAAFLWMTEAISIGVTGILIILLQSILGIVPLKEGLAAVAHPVNAVVLVGYLLAGSLVNSGMDRRLSLMVISRMGEKTNMLILGIMISTAFLAMWMSSTATVAIMVPISLGIIKMSGAKPLESNFGKVLFIGIAFAANIGGLATPTATTSNLIAIAFLNSLVGIQITFLGWIGKTIPLAIVLLPLTWIILQKVYPLEIDVVEGGLDASKKELAEMGKMSKEEKRVIFLFTAAILLWTMDSFLPLSKDWLYIVSVFITIVIVLPKVGFLTWKEAQKLIGWDVLFLVGGGLAMGVGLKNAGTIDWITNMLSGSIGNVPERFAVIIISLVTGLGITIFCSMSGTATTFVPISIGLAMTFGWNPVVFAIIAGLSSSFAFLLPANSAPNAVAYGSGYFKSSDMFKVGIIIVLLSVVVVGLYGGFILPFLV